MLDIRKGIAVTAHAALRKAFDNRMIYVMWQLAIQPTRWNVPNSPSESGIQLHYGYNEEMGHETHNIVKLG